MLSPLVGASPEGRTVTFRAAAPVTWQVVQDSGTGTYSTLERTPQSLTLRAGHSGGAKLTIKARVMSAACDAAGSAPTAGVTQCAYSASWRIMFRWQSRALSMLLTGAFGVACFFFYRYLRLRLCPNKVYYADRAPSGGAPLSQHLKVEGL